MRRCEGGARGEVFEGGGGDGLGKDALVGIEFEGLWVCEVSGGLRVEGVRERTSGLGVVSVWMNIVRRPRALEVEVFWLHLGACGLWRRGEDVMGDAFWWRHRVAALGALEGAGLMARDRERNADRGSVMEAILAQ